MPFPKKTLGALSSLFLMPLAVASFLIKKSSEFTLDVMRQGIDFFAGESGKEFKNDVNKTSAWVGKQYDHFVHNKLEKGTLAAPKEFFSMTKSLFEEITKPTQQEPKMIPTNSPHVVSAKKIDHGAASSLHL